MAWRGYPLFRHAGADGALRGTGGRLRRAHRRRLLRQHARPCRGDAPRARRAQAAAPRPDLDHRRGARPARRAAGAGRPARARRGGESAREREGQAARLEPARHLRRRRAWDAPPEAAPRAPLVAPEGRSVFEVGAGERGRAARPVPRTGGGRAPARAFAHAPQSADRGGRGHASTARSCATPRRSCAAGARIAFEAPPPEDSPLSRRGYCRSTSSSRTST